MALTSYIEIIFALLIKLKILNIPGLMRYYHRWIQRLNMQKGK